VSRHRRRITGLDDVVCPRLDPLLRHRGMVLNWDLAFCQDVGPLNPVSMQVYSVAFRTRSFAQRELPHLSDKNGRTRNVQTSSCNCAHRLAAAIASLCAAAIARERHMKENGIFPSGTDVRKCICFRQSGHADGRTVAWLVGWSAMTYSPCRTGGSATGLSAADA
jgi:hypothetical protein